MKLLTIPAKNLIKNLKNIEDVVDLSALKWMYPLEILPISALISDKKLEYILPKNEECRNYLKYFHFPNGLQIYRRSDNYIPIYNFTASSKTKSSIEIKSKILDSLISLFVQKIGSPKGALNALSLAIEESISNIEDHSGSEKGWIHAQFYQKKNFLDICILDTGRTFRENYIHHHKAVGSDTEALSRAIKGVSTKIEEIRGSGLPTFVNLARKAFKGEFVIISGKALAYGSLKL